MNEQYALQATIGYWNITILLENMSESASTDIHFIWQTLTTFNMKLFFVRITTHIDIDITNENLLLYFSSVLDNNICIHFPRTILFIYLDTKNIRKYLGTFCWENNSYLLFDFMSLSQLLPLVHFGCCWIL